MAVVAVAAATAAIILVSSGQSVACDKTASSGSVSSLVSSLAPGQTGCLHAGTYTGDIDIRTPSITLTSYPGETATVVGRLYVTQTGDGVTVSNLHLAGRSANPALPSPTVDGDNITFSGNDVTNTQGICFNIGSGNPKYGRAHDVVIENNRIHNCGILPPGNHDQGIYVEASDNLVIRNNIIDHNADRGIQLYPDADGTVITNNVIDGNGEGVIFSGEFVNGVYQASDNNTVTHNLITNSKVRYNVESYYPTGGRSGTGNVVTGNCIHGVSGNDGTADGGAGIQSSQNGFTATNNLNADPLYVNAAAGDYSLQSGSPCASVLSGLASPPPPPRRIPGPSTSPTHR
jgi:parallel beta-helix repeat protein